MGTQKPPLKAAPGEDPNSLVARQVHNVAEETLYASNAVRGIAVALHLIEEGASEFPPMLGIGLGCALDLAADKFEQAHASLEYLVGEHVAAALAKPAA